MAAAQSSSWRDLQPQLLGLILGRLPSLADRVRLRAVCQTWRYNARLQPIPPPLPWLSLLNGTFLSIPGGEIHRMPISADARYHGSVDNWLLLMHKDGRFSLVNPFSKTALQLPKLATIWHREMRNAFSGNPLFYKLVTPSPLNLSPDSLVAALIMDNYFHSAVCICQPPIPTDTLRLRENNRDHICDVVSFNGKLYAFISRKLFLLELAENHQDKPKISSTKCIVDTIKLSDVTRRSRSLIENYLFELWYYLVESVGRLLLVVRQVGVLLPLPQHGLVLRRTIWFNVFEADLTANSCHTWRRVSSLAGQAL
ncbi:unnamed protein product [Urochloa decumbens]|uniref:KIB1-4 beta-propeller domain-containing protein n=1 Tax=Urochloa decumbens TaxID=240449 RepID=A0ABC9E4R6_9POAL